MIKILTCFSIVLAVVCGQTCDFQAFYDCMKPSDADKPQDPTIAEIKAGSEKCLTDAGCSLPQMPQNNNKDATKQCMSQIIESAKQDVESCMQAQFPSFTFPALNGSYPVFGQHPSGEMEKPSDEEIKKILSQSCTTDAARQSVVSCMKSLIESKKSQLTPRTQHQKPDFSAMKTKMCEKKNQCIATLSSGCQTQLSSMKDQMCTCVKNEVSSKGDSFKAQMKACMPEASSSTRQRATGGWKRNSPSGKFTGAQQNHDAKEGMQKVVDMICSDPCTSSS